MIYGGGGVGLMGACAIAAHEAGGKVLGVIPAFKDHNLAQIAGRLAADETMHWTALTSALGRPLPTKALSFGA